MRTISLFSGIGGLDLGLERAGFEIVAQCEIDPYCRKVLKKHWPDVPCFEDVTADSDWPDAECVVGGFPCQDLSLGGKRAGIHAERSGLFFALMRVVGIVRPAHIILENVPGLLAGPGNMGAVLGELAARGFDASWDCIPAGAFGAHFRGERVFIHAACPPARCMRLQGSWSPPDGTHPWRQRELERLVRVEVEHGVPTGSIGRVSDGVPNRAHRLRALGNSVVPQVAEWIGRAVLEANAR